MERRSDGPRHLAGLDALRALAILLVLTFHYPYSEGPAWFAAIAQYGWAGVDLFFVLSGFLIGRQLLSPLARGEALDLLVVHALHQALEPRGYGPFSGVTVLACAVAVPAVAWCLHRLVERPFLALRERLTMKEAHGWDSVRSG